MRRFACTALGHTCGSGGYFGPPAKVRKPPHDYGVTLLGERNRKSISASAWVEDTGKPVDSSAKTRSGGRPKSLYGVAHAVNRATGELGLTLGPSVQIDVTGSRTRQRL